MTTRLGIPYARANEDGPGVYCPICGLLCVGCDESQETYEDAMTKGDVAVYGEHYAKTHMCRWFLKCENDATGTTPHPILGDVPTCDRCHDFATKPLR